MLSVKKRNGKLEVVNFEKVNSRLLKLNSYPTPLKCNSVFVAQQVIGGGITQGVETRHLDELAAKIAYDMSINNPDYAVLAARVATSNHHKNTPDCFSDFVELAYRNVDAAGVSAPRVNQQFYKFVQCHKTRLNRMIIHENDYSMNYVGFLILMDRYLIKRSGAIETVRVRPQDYVIERVQYMWMRVAISLYMNRDYIEDDDLDAVERCYRLLSEGYISHATPTLFNAGTPSEQLISCFLTTCEDDIGDIYRLLGDMAKISKFAGGIGFITNLRGAGTEIAGINGFSNGMIPFLKVFEATANAVDQGSKRKGSFAHFIQPFHPDFPRWIELRRPVGIETIEDLFYGIMMPDLFMRRVEQDGLWYFFDPHTCPELYMYYGERFEQEYERLVREKRYVGRPVKAQELWNAILITQIQTGMPYIIYSDHVNRKCNQKNIPALYREWHVTEHVNAPARGYTRDDIDYNQVGAIRSSNLCVEILEHTSPDETACCCVAALCLPKYASRTGGFDYELLAEHAGRLTENLNRLIDVNMYPIESARLSNRRHRPIAIGVQGLADVASILRLPFASQEFRQINRNIHEAVYYGCLRASCELARRDGAYESFPGSPFSLGEFQFDLWGVSSDSLMWAERWRELREDVMRHGVRNSLLTSIAPTASTSRIQGHSECIEPRDNIETIKTMSGDFVRFNRYLMEDLIELGLWNKNIQDRLLSERGSVQNLDVPDWIKAVYKTVWEHNVSHLIEMDADRAIFIDQSQSSNRFVKDPTTKFLTKMHFYAWRKGLKTGMYYLRSLAKTKPKGFAENITKEETVTPTAAANAKKKTVVCTDEICTMCSV